MPIPLKCPLCSAPADRLRVVTPHVYGGRPDQAFFRCGDCDVCFLFPGLTPEEEQKFYAAEFSSFMAGRAGAQAGWDQPEKHVKANDWMVARRMKYLEPRLPAKGRVLEVGCSSGFMLYPLMDRGLECVAIEPSGVFKDYVVSRGVECFDTMEALEQDGRSRDGFDLVLHGFVLEHIAAPKEFLARQLALLKPGGRLVFELPNSAEPLLTIYDIPVFERFYWIVAHTWYFSEPSLSYLLTSLGEPFEILLDQRYDLSNHAIWNRDGRPGGMGRFTPIWGAQIEQQYRQALIDSRRCDTLIGVVTRRTSA